MGCSHSVSGPARPHAPVCETRGRPGEIGGSQTGAPRATCACGAPKGGKPGQEPGAQELPCLFLSEHLTFTCYVLGSHVEFHLRTGFLGLQFEHRWTQQCPRSPPFVNPDSLALGALGCDLSPLHLCCGPGGWPRRWQLPLPRPVVGRRLATLTVITTPAPCRWHVNQVFFIPCLQGQTCWLTQSRLPAGPVTMLYIHVGKIHSGQKIKFQLTY